MRLFFLSLFACFPCVVHAQKSIGAAPKDPPEDKVAAFFRDVGNPAKEGDAFKLLAAPLDPKSTPGQVTNIREARNRPVAELAGWSATRGNVAVVAVFLRAPYREDEAESIFLIAEGGEWKICNGLTSWSRDAAGAANDAELKKLQEKFFREKTRLGKKAARENGQSKEAKPLR